MSIEIGLCLALSTLLFGIGAGGFLLRRNMLIQLMAIEVMLNATNVALVSINRLHPGDHAGQVFAFFVIAIAAAEAAVGLAIVLGFFRVLRTVETDQADQLKH